MSVHLKVLQDMFPGNLLLDVDQIASCMRVSPGHIHNLVSAKVFPLKLERGFGRRTMVSIVAMAKYLDDKLMPDDPTAPAEQVVVKRKPGRPRGTTRGVAQAQFFQTELAASVFKSEGQRSLLEALDYIKATSISSEVDAHCLAEFTQMKIVLSAQLSAVAARFFDLTSSIKHPVLGVDVMPKLSIEESKLIASEN